MRCSVCGRKLTDAESIKRGCGPVCWKRENGYKSVASKNIDRKLEDHNVPGQLTFEDCGFVIQEVGDE